MTIKKWNPFSDLVSLSDRLNQLFDEGLWGEGEEELQSLTRWKPSTDIYETKDNYVFSVELPGFDKKNLEVEIKNNTMMIKGEKKREGEVKEEDYHRIERSYGQFQRSFRLPQNVDEKKIDAKMENGVLKITVPKKEVAKSKKIDVK